MHHLIAVRTIQPTLKSALELHKPKPPQFICSGTYESCEEYLKSIVVAPSVAWFKPNMSFIPIYTNDDWTYWILEDKS